MVGRDEGRDGGRREGRRKDGRVRKGGERKVCSCAPVFNFLRLLLTGDTTKCRSPKYGKLWLFAARGQHNKPINTKLACKRIARVYYSTSNVALIGKRGLVHMSKFAQNYGFWPPEADTVNTFSLNLTSKRSTSPPFPRHSFSTSLPGR